MAGPGAEPEKVGGQGEVERDATGGEPRGAGVAAGGEEPAAQQSALGAFFRRIAARRGLAKAITATAYKLARIIYALLKHGTAYVAQGLAAYETAYRERVVRQVKRKAAELGLVVVERDAVAQPS